MTYHIQWTVVSFLLADVLTAAADNHLICVTSHGPNAYNDILDTYIQHVDMDPSAQLTWKLQKDFIDTVLLSLS